MTYQQGLNQIEKAVQKITEANQLTVESVMNVSYLRGNGG